MKRVYVNINNKVLQWAQARAHYTAGALAKKLGVSEERYAQWLTGEAKPTLNQLHNIVLSLRQPLQVFFMDDIPEEPEILTEMRRLPGAPSGEESPQLVLQIRLAMERRDIALRLYQELGEDLPQVDLTVDITQDPESLAPIVREHIGVDIEQQSSWSDPYEALRAWRASLENHGTLIFHIPKVEVGEMRGFAVAFDSLPIIGINSKDSPRGRVFTLLHEFAHILLRDSALHSLRGSWFRIAPDVETELFCNSLAGAVLVPKSDLLKEARKAQKAGKADWEHEEIAPLASRYQVSRAVIVRRLDKLRLISRNSFRELLRDYDAPPPVGTGQSGGDFYANLVAHLGTLIPRLAFRGYYDHKLTASDLSSIMGLKVKHLGRMEERVLGAPYGFEAR